MINTFVITGRPGSGKTLQSKRLAKSTGYTLFSPGEHYRDIATRDNAFGKKVKEAIDSGQLGPYWLSIYLFQDAILNTDNTEGVIFEGIGRKEEEARVFNEVMEWLSRDYVVLDIVVSEEEVTKRLTLRGDIEFREDDDPEDIPVRIEEYNKHTKPAIDFFESVGKHIEINGNQTIEEVERDILDAIENL